MRDDLDPLELHLLDALAELVGPGAPQAAAPEAAALWRAQIDSRHCDFAARWLQKEGRSFYTIASAGHESNAAVALALRPTDPALLHYRSGGFYLARSGQVGHDGVGDILLGVTAARDEPIAGGRHKVFGHHDLAVIPQTSTIASHLPRAVGVAIAIDRARKLGVDCTWPLDAVVVCSFGDASLNHAAAQAALNTAAHAAHQHLPLPLLLVCEDNGLGISVPTPAGWAEGALRARSQLRYERLDGDDPAGLLAGARELAQWVRESRRPAVLHLRTVRYLGHAGADVESAYRSPQAVRADWARDPILATARWLVAAGARSGAELAADYVESRARVRERALEAARLPQLGSAQEVMRPLAPRSPAAVAAAAGARGRSSAEPLTLAQAVNSALADALERHPEALLFGEDVAAKGGVYGVTRGLHARFGAGRVFDTLLDETSILGLALGASVSGLLPLPEIQYLAYLHNAEDQLRGEAATLQFFSQGQYRNGMVVRIAGYGYQKGFGGHFHNDDSVAVLRDIPGLVIASPSRPDDAAAMLRTCVAAAKVDGSVCAFLEPIALYHTRDLYEERDGAWLAAPSHEHVALGSARTYGDGRDLTILTWGNGLYLSLRVARRLDARGVKVRVVDLRWLAPLPIEDIAREVAATGRVLVVDETRRTGGVSEGILAALVDIGFEGPMARVTSKDSFVPLGDAATLVLVSENEIEAAALALV
ncbi:Transketolase, pyrimidine binding domain [Gaiella occulta]|uniref:Transketolase, pyrimidine binding domain n=1 Tax=Gaiella occulta TaxID=1002870 RepID=A0A7M2Z228_9ACTN|nr:thiamine pyrophosphate-dependent enzyme [Gaiella occulta]RDI75912.1 Transketolase, pyrimidine binding domain [Gaiella occulta]